MNTDEIIYRNLQKHLDRQAVGFPKTKPIAKVILLEVKLALLMKLFLY